MRQITSSDLVDRTDLEIAILFHMASQALGRTAPGTPARQAVIASLQAISFARAARQKANREPGL